MATNDDDETIIGPNEAALVAEESGELCLILPEYDDDEDVPPMALLLAAVTLKLGDEKSLEDTMDVDRSAESFDEATYADDLADCRGGSTSIMVLNGLGGAMVGSAYGFVEGIWLGVVAGNSAEGAVIGTIVGGVVGLSVGA